MYKIEYNIEYDKKGFPTIIHNETLSEKRALMIYDAAGLLVYDILERNRGDLNEEMIKRLKITIFTLKQMSNLSGTIIKEGNDILDEVSSILNNNNKNEDK